MPSQPGLSPCGDNYHPTPWSSWIRGLVATRIRFEPRQYKGREEELPFASDVATFVVGGRRTVPSIVVSVDLGLCLSVDSRRLSRDITRVVEFSPGIKLAHCSHAGLEPRDRHSFCCLPCMSVVWCHTPLVRLIWLMAGSDGSTGELTALPWKKEEKKRHSIRFPLK